MKNLDPEETFLYVKAVSVFGFLFGFMEVPTHKLVGALSLFPLKSNPRFKLLTSISRLVGV